MEDSSCSNLACGLFWTSKNPTSTLPAVFGTISHRFLQIRLQKPVAVDEWHNIHHPQLLAFTRFIAFLLRSAKLFLWFYLHWYICDNNLKRRHENCYITLKRDLLVEDDDADNKWYIQSIHVFVLGFCGTIYIFLLMFDMSIMFKGEVIMQTTVEPIDTIKLTKTICYAW